LFTLALLVVMGLAQRYLAALPDPALFYLAAVVYSAYAGGISGGLISAALCIAYALFSLSVAGASFPYQPHRWLRFSGLALTAVAAALLVGNLKRHSQRASDLTAGEMENRLLSYLDRLHALHEINLAISSKLDQRAIIDVLLQEIRFFAAYVQAASVRLLNEEAGRLDLVACWNVDLEEWKLHEVAELRGRSREVVQHKSPVLVANVQTDPRTRHLEFYRRHGLVSYLGVPLLAQEQVLGVLAVYTREEREFTSEEIEFLSTLAGLTAIAIHNSRLYEQTRRQAAQLEEANRLQADFSAMIAHDLRAPLTAVIGGTAMMEDGVFGTVNEEQKKYLAKMQSYIRGLVDHVSDLLDLSKLEAGRLDLAKEEVDLRQLIQASMETYHPLARDKKLTLKSRFNAPLPRIKADPRRLEQVLANLLTNAIKFTPEGGEIEVGASQENNSEVRLWVKDSGVGIPAQEIGSLFEKYRQTTSGKSSSQKGTGLGLVICKMIVEAHGGKITVGSEEGKGTTFTVRIPCPISSKSTGIL